MLIEELQKRKVPSFLPESANEWLEQRASILDILQKEEYGYMPPACPVTAEITSILEHQFGDKCVQYEAKLTCELQNGRFSFPATAIIPKINKPVPAILLISFAAVIPSKNLPAEELIDEGVAIFTFCYKDVVPDNKEALESELPHLLFGDRRGAHDPGTIAMWAWAASRVMDWALTFDGIRHDRIAVVGQSRLGKTALLAGAMDERFAVAYSNDSGCCGAAISRGKDGEDFAAITTNFPYWFCEEFMKYANHKEKELPLDQDALIAAIAPRGAYVASSVMDEWSDPKSEFLSVASASRIWKLLGLSGLVAPDRFPMVNEAFHEGCVGYHMREGTHTLNRNDWHFFLPFFKKYS